MLFSEDDSALKVAKQITFQGLAYKPVVFEKTQCILEYVRDKTISWCACTKMRKLKKIPIMTTTKAYLLSFHRIFHKKRYLPKSSSWNVFFFEYFLGKISPEILRSSLKSFTMTEHFAYPL